jgi:hypothetical protein
MEEISKSVIGGLGGTTSRRNQKVTSIKLFEKCVVEKMISSKSDRVGFIKNIGTSEVWPNDDIVTVDREPCGFVRCKSSCYNGSRGMEQAG